MNSNKPYNSSEFVATKQAAPLEGSPYGLEPGCPRLRVGARVDIAMYIPSLLGDRGESMKVV